MAKNLRIDFANKKIEVTTGFYKKAQEFGTPEFRQLMEAKKELKEYTDVEFNVEIVKKTKKAVSIDEPREKKIRPSYKMMYDFIKAEDPKGLEEFKRQREMVRFGTTKYNATLSWFLDTYSNKEEYADAFYALKSAVAENASEEEPTEENNTVEYRQAK